MSLHHLYHCHEICLCNQFPCSYHKQECIQCCASCMSILGCYSQFGSCIWLPVTDVLEQEVEMFEVAQIPHHTPATPSPLDEVPQILSILELEDTHEGCDTLLLLQLVVKIVVLHGIYLKPPFHKIVYIGGNPVCQLMLHCRLLLVLSPLHLSHHA